MNFEECAAKPLLAEAGIAVPRSRLATTSEEAAAAARALGPVVVKAQVPAGKRGKAGGIRRAQTPEEAESAARGILGMAIGGHAVARVLVEEQVAIERELYAAVLNDAAARQPLVLFSTEGGMDIEEIAAARPERVRRHHVDIRSGLADEAARALVRGLDLGDHEPAVAKFLVSLYSVYRRHDAELLEVNPLALTASGPVALDCKFVMDDSAAPRHAELAARGTPETLSPLEQRGKDLALKFIELDGNVGVLANGAGLTMATMDMVRHWGGRPANFLEIGGESYTRAKPALELVLANPHVKSLVVNFCGAFARCDVMMEGVAAAWQELKPSVPIFFSIDGTGDVEAIAILKKRLGLDPFPTMALACKAAVEAAR
ncbi:MAG: succinate--CoA ligase [Rhodospirillales bacterium]|nr:succinate--CoA ligase [Rhodospirillales bacterium]